LLLTAMLQAISSTAAWRACCRLIVQQSIDIACLQGAQQQTSCPTLLQWSIDGTDKQTDGRTRDRYIDPAAYFVSFYIMYATYG